MKKILTIIAGLTVAAGISSADTTCDNTTLAVIIGGPFSCEWTVGFLSPSTVTFENFTVITNGDGAGGQVPLSTWAVSSSEFSGGNNNFFRITLTPGSGITETSPAP